MNTTSKEVGQALKEAGVECESEFWWVPGQIEYGYEGEQDILPDEENYSVWDRKPDEYNFIVPFSEDALYADIKTIEGEKLYLKEYKRVARERKRLVKISFPAYTLQELVPVLQALGRIKGWKDAGIRNYNTGKIDGRYCEAEWFENWNHICWTYANKGFPAVDEYILNLLK